MLQQFGLDTDPGVTFEFEPAHAAAFVEAAESRPFRVDSDLTRGPAQTLLRWGIQHGMVVLAKSVHPPRIAENAAVFDFELPAEAMAELDALEEGLVTGWDPRDEP